MGGEYDIYSKRKSTHCYDTYDDIQLLVILTGFIYDQ